jgi:SNF2 family DNA or RNA helicase
MSGGILQLVAFYQLLIVSLFQEDQAINRVHRIGQKKVVTVHKIYIGDSIESWIMDIQDEKRKTVNAVFTLGSESKSARPLTLDQIKKGLGMNQ